MTRRDAQISWRLSELNWILVGLLAAAMIASLIFTDFTLGLSGVVVTCAFAAAYAGVAYYNAKAPHRQDPEVVFALGGTAQIVMITALATPLSYVAASFAGPLQDASLYAIDRALGIDGRDYLAFVDRHPLLATWLQVGYGMIAWPMLAIPVILAAAHRFSRMQEYLFAYAVALSATIVISVFVPALGIFSLADPSAYPNISAVAYVSSAEQLPQIRDGSVRYLDMFALTGVVTFPSFHTATAVLYLWALWPVRWIRPVALVANFLMIASCPVNGAHYFVDLAAGAAVAVLAIVAARQVSQRVAARVPLHAVPAPAVAAATA